MYKFTVVLLEMLGANVDTVLEIATIQGKIEKILPLTMVFNWLGEKYEAKELEFEIPDHILNVLQLVQREMTTRMAEGEVSLKDPDTQQPLFDELGKMLGSFDEDAFCADNGISQQPQRIIH